MRGGSHVGIVWPQSRRPGYLDFRFADDGIFFLVVGFGFRDPTYARLISKKRRSSFVFTRSESGTTTYSGCTDSVLRRQRGLVFFQERLAFRRRKAKRDRTILVQHAEHVAVQ